jgi:hypothetical protein
MHSDWFNVIDILQGRWQHGEKVGYCYSSGLEKTPYKWEVYVPLVTKGLKHQWCRLYTVLGKVTRNVNQHNVLGEVKGQVVLVHATKA